MNFQKLLESFTDFLSFLKIARRFYISANFYKVLKFSVNFNKLWKIPQISFHFCKFPKGSSDTIL